MATKSLALGKNNEAANVQKCAETVQHLCCCCFAAVKITSDKQVVCYLDRCPEKSSIFLDVLNKGSNGDEHKPFFTN